MKQVMTVCSICLCLLALLACGSKHEGPVLTGLDPVSLTQGEQIVGNAEFSVTHDGYQYLFSSAENKATFESDPETYGIQGDGSCPVIPSAKSDPDIFTVYEGKIYILASTACIDNFEADPEAYVG